MSNELTTLLNKVMGTHKAVYRGVIVRQLIGGFEVFGKECKTTEDVDKLIDESLKNLENSLK